MSVKYVASMKQAKLPPIPEKDLVIDTTLQLEGKNTGSGRESILSENIRTLDSPNC